MFFVFMFMFSVEIIFSRQFIQKGCPSIANFKKQTTNGVYVAMIKFLL